MVSIKISSNTDDNNKMFHQISTRIMKHIILNYILFYFEAQSTYRGKSDEWNLNFTLYIIGGKKRKKNKDKGSKANLLQM